MFVIGAVATGAGSGLVLKTLLALVIELAPPDKRGEVLAAFFLAGYLGLAVPVMGSAILAGLLSASVLMTVFAATATAALMTTVRGLHQFSGQFQTEALS